MNYKEVKNLLEGVASDLDATVQFDHGRRSDWNAKDNKYPAILLAPPTINTTFTNSVSQMNDSYSVVITFYTLSKVDAPLEELTNDISLVDKIRRQYLVTLNNEDNVVIDNVSSVPFFKALDDCLTGFQVTMTLGVPDNYRYCC